MARLLSFLKRLALWLGQGCHLFSGPLVAIVPPFLVAWLWPAELGFRIVGFILQVLGVWIVWVGIRGTREQFNVPGSWAQMKGWWSGRPRLRGRTVIAGMAAMELEGVTASGRGDQWHGAGENPSVEKRFEAIEKNLRNVRDDLSAFQKESDDRNRAHNDDMKRERAEREAADQVIHAKIKETETGGLKLNAAGVWWLASGTVCSTFPHELTKGVGLVRVWLIGT